MEICNHTDFFIFCPRCSRFYCQDCILFIFHELPDAYNITCPKCRYEFSDDIISRFSDPEQIEQLIKRRVFETSIIKYQSRLVRLSRTFGKGTGPDTYTKIFDYLGLSRSYMFTSEKRGIYKFSSPRDIFSDGNNYLLVAAYRTIFLRILLRYRTVFFINYSNGIDVENYMIPSYMYYLAKKLQPFIERVSQEIAEYSKSILSIRTRESIIREISEGIERELLGLSVLFANVFKIEMDEGNIKFSVSFDTLKNIEVPDCIFV